MTGVNDWLRGARWAVPARLGLLGVMSCSIAFAQSQTHTVTVNVDGTFTPQVTYIRSGDTVRWEQLTRVDSIIPADGAQGFPAMCTSLKAYGPSDPNEFTGPMPVAPSGVYTLSPLDGGYIEATGTCPLEGATIETGDNGKVLCRGGAYQATADSIWQSANVSGVFIRLLWSDINPAPGVFDFTILRREIEQAVQNGKLYSLGIKAGKDGTPDWIFSTNTDDTPRTGGGGGVTRLHLRDVADGGATGCGVRMDLGNPTGLRYRQLYASMLTEVAEFIKSRADWYRALAYMKISGANQISHENRLPKNCTEGCPCNPAIFAADGYRPSGLYAFYTEQTQLFNDLFPGKSMSYALLQAGFPRINETGGYLTSTGSSSDASPLIAGFEQTESILDLGQQSRGTSFVVQHNGLGQKAAGCPFDGTHPKPLRPRNDYRGTQDDSNCPNRWVLQEGAQGQVTGYQTNNLSQVATPSDLDLTFQNLWDNSDGVFLEVYERMLWRAENTSGGVLPNSGKTIDDWTDDLHLRRNDPIYQHFTAAGNPFPADYSHTFTNTGTTTEYLYYVHGMKCGDGGDSKQEWGLIVIDANPFTTPDRGGSSLTTSGSAPSINVGYGRIRPDVGNSTPAGVAIFGYRPGENLVSETSVPATASLRSGQIYAEVDGSLNTGLAIVNPNDQTASINFNFTDADGIDLGFGTTTIPPNGQVAKFLDQAPFKTFSGSAFQGTFSFTSDLPLGVIAIRGLLNERQDFLMATLPVIDTTAPAASGTAVIPHFADGGGWTTLVLLVNPTSNTIAGNLEFKDGNGDPSNVTIAGQTGSIFAYSIPPRSSRRLATDGSPVVAATGSVRVLPTGGGTAPTALVVFPYKPAGVTLSEPGVAATDGTAFRMYVESSGTDGAPGNIQSGVAIANSSSTAATVTLELTDLAGSSSGLPAPVVLPVLPALGHTARFLAEFFPDLPDSFQGILRVSSVSTEIAVAGLRTRYNERQDFLITTTPPTNEAAPVSLSESLFPHLADGGGYTTQFILFSGSPGQSSAGSLILVDQSGQPLVETLAAGSQP